MFSSPPRVASGEIAFRLCITLSYRDRLIGVNARDQTCKLFSLRVNESGAIRRHSGRDIDGRQFVLHPSTILALSSRDTRHTPRTSDSEPFPEAGGGGGRFDRLGGKNALRSHALRRPLRPPPLSSRIPLRLSAARRRYGKAEPCRSVYRIVYLRPT